MSKINLNIVATSDFSNVLSQINTLRTQVAKLNTDIAKTGGISAQQIASIKSAVSAYDSVIKSSGAFNRSIVDVQDSTVKFGRSLQDGKLKVGEYFKSWKDGARGVQGDLRKLAEQQVALQQSVIRTDPFKAGRAYVDTPNQIDKVANATKIATMHQQLFNLSLVRGSDALINWGKNTQWAGRQLTVGLTVPIALFGKKAADAFLELDKQLVRVTKVYGSGLNAASDAVLANIRTQVTELGQKLAKEIGIPIQETAAIAADIAATGATGTDLINATNEAVRLSTLGELDRQSAVKATISLQNVFKLNTNDLTESINFLNAVENQTSTSLGDLVEAIPKASPVVAQLGGSFKDVAVMMVAMKEAGVPASEAANAIKSSVGSLINPTQKATENLSKFGINLNDIVTKNRGNLPQLFMEFQKELSKLSNLQRAKVIEEIFGKYQFARISALLENIGQQGSQTQQVFELMGASAAQTAKLADSELKAMTESSSGRYARALSSFQAAIAPIGEKFLDFASSAMNFFSGIAEFVDKNPMLKNILSWGAAFVAIVGPIVMLGGVLANFVGYLLKGVAVLKNFKDGYRGFTEIATPATIAAQKAGELFEKTLITQSEAANILKLAIKDLNRELGQYEAMAGRGGGGPFGPGGGGRGGGGGGPRNPLYPSGYPRGPYSPKPTTIVTGPGGPKGDVIPAMLSAGEGILNAEAVRNLSPERVEKINKDPRLAAAMNRIYGIHTTYNADAPEGFNPYTYNSEKVNKRTGEVTPASVIEGHGARQRWGVGFAPAYYPSGGGGADIYHTTAFSKILEEAGYVSEPPVEGESKKQKRRKEARARLIEGYTPPSGTINAKASIPSLIQQAAGDAQQNYYEPSPEDVKKLAAAGVHLDPKLIESAREDYIVGLAKGNKAKEAEIRTQMAKMSDQDAKDWLGKSQIQSKATAAVLQEHMHSLIKEGPDGEKAARQFERGLQQAAKTGNPAKLQEFIGKDLQKQIDKRTKTLNDTFQRSVKSELSAIPKLERTPAAVSQALQNAARKIDENLDDGYVERVKGFVNGKKVIGGRRLFMAVSGISRISTDPNFSGTVRGVNEDLKYSVKELHNLTGDEGKKADRAIDSYSRSVQAAGRLPVGQQEAAIKTAAVRLERALSKLGQTAIADIESINRMVVSATAQLAGVAVGSEAGVAARAAAGAARVPLPPRKKKAAEGGHVSGPGGPKSDVIPALLSNGEYVINAATVKKLGTGFFDNINKYSSGGVARLAGGGMPSPTGSPLTSPQGMMTIPNFDVNSGKEYEDFLKNAKEKSDEFAESTRKVGEELPKAGGEAEKDSKGFKKLGESFKAGGMAGFGLSMILGTAAAKLSTMESQSAKAAGSVAEFAAMGSIFGPWGTAIGGAVGAMKALNDITNENIRIQQNTLQGTFTLSSEEAAFFGKTINKLSDSLLTNLVGSTEKAKTKVKELSEMYSQSADPATQDFIKSIRDADPATATNILVEKYKSGIVQGLSEIDSKQIIAALQEATGKTGLTMDIKARITLLKDMSPEEMFGSQMEKGMGDYFNGIGAYNADQYREGVRDSLDQTPVSFASGFLAGAEGFIEGIKQKLPEAIQPIAGAMFAVTNAIPFGLIMLNKLLPSTAEGFDAAAAAAGPMGDQIMAAFNSQSIKTFGNELDSLSLNTISSDSAALALNVKRFGAEAAGATSEILKLNNLDTEEKLNNAGRAGVFFKTAVEKIRKESPLMAAEIEKAALETGDMKTSLLAAQAVMQGVVGTQDNVKRAFRDPVYLRILVERSQYNKDIDKFTQEAYKKIGKQTKITVPIDLEMKDDSAQQEAIRNKYEAADAAAQKHFDKAIKKQDVVINRNNVLIDNINEERDARQKIYDLQEKNLDNSIKTANLQNDIAKAIAEGDLAKAAALKIELKGQQAKASADAKEAALRSKEDVDIKAYQRRIKRAEIEKNKLEDQKKTRIDALKAAEKAELDALKKETAAINIKRKAANVAAKAAYQAQLDSRQAAMSADEAFKRIATRLKNHLFTNPDLAMKDSVIRKLRDEMVQAGYEPAVIDEAIQTMLRNSGASATTFMDGVGASIYDEVYTRGIAHGLDPSEANLAANNAVDSIQAVLTDPANKLTTAIQTELTTLASQEGISMDSKGNIVITGPLSPEATDILTKLEKDGIIKRQGAGFVLNGNIAKATPISITVTPILKGSKFTVNATGKIDKWSAGANPPRANVAGRIITWSYASTKPVTVNGNLKIKYTFFTTGPGNYFVKNDNTGKVKAISLRQYMDERVPAGFATGGYINGRGTKTSDSIPAMLSNGEYVVNAAAVDKMGVGFFDNINNLSMGQFNMGGATSKYSNGYSMGGQVMPAYSDGGSVSEKAMYNNNYSINVNVAGTNASAEDIAQRVLNVIQRRESMNRTVTRT